MKSLSASLTRFIILCCAFSSASCFNLSMLLPTETRYTKTELVTVRIYPEQWGIDLGNKAVKDDLLKNIIIESRRTEKRLSAKVVSTSSNSYTLYIQGYVPRQDTIFFNEEASTYFKLLKPLALYEQDQLTYANLVVEPKKKAIRVTFVDNSPSGSLSKRFPELFNGLRRHITEQLEFFDGLSLLNAKAELFGDSLFVPRHLWEIRDRIILRLKNSIAIVSETSSSPLKEHIQLTVRVREASRDLAFLDDADRPLKQDPPSVTLSYGSYAVKSEKKNPARFTIVPKLSYRVQAVNNYFEYGPVLQTLDRVDNDIRMVPIMELYPIKIERRGLFVQGSLPDSVLCTASNGKRRIIPFSDSLLAVEKREHLAPPLRVTLLNKHSNDWQLEIADLYKDKTTIVKLERTLRSAMLRFSLALDDAGKNTTRENIEVSLSAESMPKEYRNFRMKAGEEIQIPIDWPRVSRETDIIKVRIKKPQGYNVVGDSLWYKHAYEQELPWNGEARVSYTLTPLEELPVIFIDLSYDHIDRKTLIAQVERFLNVVDNRINPPRDCLLWVSNGLDRSFGYMDRAQEAQRKIGEFIPVTQDFFNELRRLVRHHLSAYQYIDRVETAYHLFLSLSSFKWVKGNIAELKKVLAELNIPTNRLIFYVMDPSINEKRLDEITVINLAAI